jgi:hypothetical protein
MGKYYWTTEALAGTHPEGGIIWVDHHVLRYDNGSTIEMVLWFKKSDATEDILASMAEYLNKQNEKDNFEVQKQRLEFEGRELELERVELDLEDRTLELLSEQLEFKRKLYMFCSNALDEKLEDYQNRKSKMNKLP